MSAAVPGAGTAIPAGPGKAKAPKGEKAQDNGKNNARNNDKSDMPAAWEPRYRGSRAGKGKGTQQKGGFTIVSKTPDRQSICYAYNTEGKSCDGKCNMIHCCRILGCYSTTHPMFKHPGWKADQA